jgi:hypothetical protein
MMPPPAMPWTNVNEDADSSDMQRAGGVSEKCKRQIGDLLDEIGCLAQLGQYDLADSVIPAHNFISDTLEPSSVLPVQVLFCTIQNVRDPKFVDAPLVAQRLARRDVKPVRDFVYRIAHMCSLADANAYMRKV